MICDVFLKPDHNLPRRAWDKRKQRLDMHKTALFAGARIDGAHDCTHGCLFNVNDDKGEHTDLASQQPDRVAAMNETLLAEKRSFFTNNDKGRNSALCPSPDTTVDQAGVEAAVGKGDDCGCWMAIHHYGTSVAVASAAAADDDDAPPSLRHGFGCLSSVMKASSPT